MWLKKTKNKLMDILDSLQIYLCWTFGKSIIIISVLMMGFIKISELGKI